MRMKKKLIGAAALMLTAMLLAALAILWVVLPRDPARKAGGC